MRKIPSAQGHGGRDGTIPSNNMAITPVHHLMDVTLFKKIVVCETTALSTEDQALSNDGILTMERDNLCALCHRCKFKVLVNTGTLKSKSISVSGNECASNGAQALPCLEPHQCPEPKQTLVKASLTSSMTLILNLCMCSPHSGQREQTHLPEMTSCNL